MMNLLPQEDAGRFIDWGILHISVGNLVVIAVMLIVFVLAIVVPFPGHSGDRAAGPPSAEDAPAPGEDPR